MTLYDERASGKACDLRRVEISLGKVFDALHTCVRRGELRLFDQFLEMIVLASGPFMIHKQTKAIFKGQGCHIGVG